MIETVSALPQSSILDSGSSYFRTVANLGIQAAEALEHAHQLGVIHRDIKPANLMVENCSPLAPRGRGDGGEGVRLWITDFGLAHCQGGCELTMSGDLLGTLRYMSPEQALAQRVLVDQRTDIYSLGVTLYELLTLEPAFPGTDRQELLRQIAFEDPKPPKRLNKGIPAELDTIVLKAIEKNPADRYATAQELADDLRRFLMNEPIRARRPTWRQQANKWVRRHPGVTATAIASAILGLLLAMVGLAVNNHLVRQEQQHTEEVARQEKAAKDLAQSRLAQIEKANDILGSIFKNLDPNAEEKGGPALRVQLGEQLDQAAKLLEGEAVGDPLTVARLQDVLGTSLRELGHYHKAQPLLEKAWQTRETCLGPDHPDSLTSKKNLAELYLRQGKYDRAEPLLQEVLQAQTTQRGADHHGTLDLKNSLAALYHSQGKYDQAEPLYQEVLPALTAKLGADHPDTLNCKNNLAVLYYHQAKYDQAERLYQEVLQGETAKFGPDHPRTLTSKNNLALLYRAQGNYDRAEPLFREVLPALTAMLGADHPVTLNSKNSLASLYFSQAKYDHAEPLHREVLQAQTAKLGADHPETLASKNNLATLYLEQGKYNRAEPLFQEVLQASTSKLGADHPNTLVSKLNLAGLYRNQGKYDRAEPLYLEVVQARTAKLGAEHPESLKSKNGLGALYRDQRNYDRAVPLFQVAVAGARRKLGLAHPETQMYMRNLSECYELMGQPAKAEPVCRELAEFYKKQAGAESPQHAAQLASLGLNLLVQKKYDEAEPVLRDCLAIRAKKEPEAWATFNAKSMLGAALLGQKKYADAEPLLVQGYDGMKQREAKVPKVGKVRLTEALERLVQLYDAWGKKEKAAEWGTKLQAQRDTQKKTEEPKEK